MSNASLSEPSQVLQNEDLFESLMRACQRWRAIPVAVCWPCSAVSLEGAVKAARSGLICPVLVGREAEIREIAEQQGLNLETFPIVDVDTEKDAAIQSVALCRSGDCASLMKGSLHTDVLMHAVLKEQGLR